LVFDLKYYKLIYFYSIIVVSKRNFKLFESMNLFLHFTKSMEKETPNCNKYKERRQNKPPNKWRQRIIDAIQAKPLGEKEDKNPDEEPKEIEQIHLKK